MGLKVSFNAADAGITAHGGINPRQPWA